MSAALVAAIQADNAAEEVLCSYTGLARLVGAKLPTICNKWQSGKNTKIGTIVVHESDPKMAKLPTELKAVQASGGLHRSCVLIFVTWADKGRPQHVGADVESDGEETWPNNMLPIRDAIVSDNCTLTVAAVENKTPVD